MNYLREKRRREVKTHHLIKEFPPLHSSRNGLTRRGKLNSELAENLIYFLNGRSVGMRPNAVAPTYFTERAFRLQRYSRNIPRSLEEFYLRSHLIYLIYITYTSWTLKDVKGRRKKNNFMTKSFISFHEKNNLVNTTLKNLSERRNILLKLLVNSLLYLAA